MLPAWVFYAVIAAVPPCWEDRGIDQSARLEVVAVALSTASEARTHEKNLDLAAKLLTVAFFEGYFCERVHRGMTAGRGRGLFQLERGSRLTPPFEGVGLEETTHAALEAVRLLKRSQQCGSGAREVFASYAGLPCGRGFRTLPERVDFYWRVRRLIDELANHDTPSE